MPEVKPSGAPNEIQINAPDGPLVLPVTATTGPSVVSVSDVAKKVSVFAGIAGTLMGGLDLIVNNADTISSIIHILPAYISIPAGAFLSAVVAFVFAIRKHNSGQQVIVSGETKKQIERAGY